MPTRPRHEEREVTGRAFAVHTRGFAPDMGKMNAIVREAQTEISSLLFKRTGRQLDRSMGLRLATQILYNVEKSSIEGLEAYMREKKVHMKYLGLLRADLIPTTRADRYLDALDGNGDPLALLREYATSMKLVCPQIKTTEFRPGQRQAGYRHYRIRPTVAFLRALATAEASGVVADTDDIVLTALRYLTPMRHARVTETVVDALAGRHFSAKARGKVDYEQEFRSMYAEFLSEIGRQTGSDEDFRRKCRNAANDAWCFAIGLRNIELIDADAPEPAHWTSARQIAKKVFPVQFQEFKLTTKGRAALAEADRRVPVWYADIEALTPFPTARRALVRAVERLAGPGRIEKPERLEIDAAVNVDPLFIGGSTTDLASLLSGLGLPVSDDGGGGLVAPKKASFDQEYDLP